MFEEYFYQRLVQLRQAKGVSAREMSLALGQSAGYINAIENQTCFPSMQVFFYICEYLDISPAEFFDANSRYPLEYQEIIQDLNALDPKNLEHIKAIVKALRR